MSELSAISKTRLAGCNSDLQLIIEELSLEMPICVCCGYRGEIDQNTAFKEGRSKLKFPHSKHNSKPSVAVDVAPLKDGKIDWNDIKLFNTMLNRILDIAKKNGVKLRLGRDFSFKDYPHVELVNFEH